METLYTNGPAGGGGVFKSAKDTVAIESTLMSEAFVTPHTNMWRLGMKLRQIAHSRTGDKGNISNISVIAFEEKHYPPLLRNVTAERVKDHFREIAHG